MNTDTSNNFIRQLKANINSTSNNERKIREQSSSTAENIGKQQQNNTANITTKKNTKIYIKLNL
jgi:hypothetical protein